MATKTSEVVRRLMPLATERPSKPTCDYKTSAGTPCRRTVAEQGQKCYQHASGFTNKLNSLYRNHAVLFWLGAASFLATTVFGTYPIVQNYIKQAQKAGPPYVEVFQNDNPILQVSFDATPLPIKIPPRHTIKILFLRENLGTSLQGFENDTDAESSWPVTTCAIVPQEIAAIFRLTNRSKASLYNIKTEFDVEFQRTGEKRTNYGEVARSIPAGQQIEIYVVNQSQYRVHIPFPKYSDLEVEGSTNRRHVSLAPYVATTEENSLSDLQVMLFQIYPSQHRWNGNQISEQLFIEVGHP